MIEFIQVNKHYANGYHALKNVNVTIQQGEFVAVIGLSGAGKSTLLRCINRMHHITDGTLTVNKVEIQSLNSKQIRKLRRGIGMIFQSFNLVTRVSAIKNVLVAFVPDMPWWRRLLGIYTKNETVRALTALERVGIIDKAYMRVDQLSGGQQQRVALARTLAQQPSIILADEPVASLDPLTAHQVMGDLKAINEQYNMTVVMNIHHVDLALSYATRVIGIRAGEIVFDGKAEEVNDALLQFIYNGKLEEGGRVDAKQAIGEAHLLA